MIKLCSNENSLGNGQINLVVVDLRAFKCFSFHESLTGLDLCPFVYHASAFISNVKMGFMIVCNYVSLICSLSS